MSREDALVSVVIATYNRPEYLRQAIASVVRGSYQNFEVVVTDDAGSEDNRRVVESFGDRRLRYRRNAMRLGAAGNHREGLKIAMGEYIGLLNDDDEWEPQFLERMVPIVDANPEVVVAFSDHWVINAMGDIDAQATEECTRRFKRDRLTAGLHRPYYRIALVDKSVPLVAALLRRNAIEWEDFPQETSSIYDFWVTYLAVRTGMGAWYLPERLARYRVHGANETSMGGERFIRPGIYVYSRLVTDPTIAELRPELEARLQLAHLSYGTFLLKEGHAGQSRQYLWAAMPNRRAAAALALSYAPKAVRDSVAGSGSLPLASNSVSRIRNSVKYRLSSYAERLLAPWLKLRHWQPSAFHPLTGVVLGARYGYDEEDRIKLAVARVVGTTQLSFPRLASLWMQVRYLDKMKIPGALVECGVWKGGASAVMAQAHLAGAPVPWRDIHMFDSWQGMPEPDAAHDGAVAIEFAGGRAGGSLTPIGVNLSKEADARDLVVNTVGYPAQLTHTHPGWFQDTVPRDAAAVGPIALLRLDGDWYDSTKVCLECLYPSVVKYGSIVVDDYGHFEGCRKAVDEFVADLGYPVMLHHVDYSGRYWIKPE